MMTQLQRAYETIELPVGLEQRLLNACLSRQSTKQAVRWMAPTVSVAACGAVLLVSLATSGSLDDWLTRVEDWTVGPDELLIVSPDGQPAKTTKAPANTTPEGPNTTTKPPLTLSTTPTTAHKPATTVVSPAPANTTPEGPNTTTKPPLTLSTTPTTAHKPATTVVSPTASGDPHYCKHAFPGDEECMTLSQLEVYFGRRIRPAWVPQDLKQQTLSIRYSVWHRNEEKMSHLSPYDKKQFEEGILRDASVIYDRNTILYRGKEDRELSVAMSTAPYPRNQLGDMSRFDETVTVAGVTAKLAYYDDSVYAGKTLYSYTALFTVDGIAFCVNGWNLPRQEFLDVVESIIE